MTENDLTEKTESQLKALSEVLETGAMQHARRMLNELSPAEIADLIECLSGHTERPDLAVSLLKDGYGKKIVALCSQTHAALKERLVDDAQIILLHREALNTYQEGEVLHKFLKDSSGKKILVVSDAYHLTRVRWTMNHFFKETPHHFVYIASSPEYFSDLWWKDSIKRKATLHELAGILYYKVAYGLMSITK